MTNCSLDNIIRLADRLDRKYRMYKFAETVNANDFKEEITENIKRTIYAASTQGHISPSLENVKKDKVTITLNITIDDSHFSYKRHDVFVNSLVIIPVSKFDEYNPLRESIKNYLESRISHEVWDKYQGYDVKFDNFIIDIVY
jgi:hypothetical protein